MCSARNDAPNATTSGFGRSHSAPSSPMYSPKKIILAANAEMSTEVTRSGAAACVRSTARQLRVAPASGAAIPNASSGLNAAPATAEIAAQHATLLPIITASGRDMPLVYVVRKCLLAPGRLDQLVEADDDPQHQPDEDAPGRCPAPSVEAVAHPAEQDDRADQRVADRRGRSRTRGVFLQGS